jgi:hypothetical protein
VGQVVHIFSEIERGADHLAHLIAIARGRIELIEREMIDHLAIVDADGQKSISTVRRIIGALEQRLDKLNQYLHDNSHVELAAAFRLLSSPLVIPNDFVNKLISEENIEPIPVAEIQPVLNHLLTSIKIQRRRQAR